MQGLGTHRNHHSLMHTLVSTYMPSLLHAILHISALLACLCIAVFFILNRPSLVPYIKRNKLLSLCCLCFLAGVLFDLSIPRIFPPLSTIIVTKSVSDHVESTSANGDEADGADEAQFFLAQVDTYLKIQCPKRISLDESCIILAKPTITKVSYKYMTINGDGIYHEIYNSNDTKPMDLSDPIVASVYRAFGIPTVDDLLVSMAVAGAEVSPQGAQNPHGSTVKWSLRSKAPGVLKGFLDVDFPRVDEYKKNPRIARITANNRGDSDFVITVNKQVITLDSAFHFVLQFFGPAFTLTGWIAFFTWWRKEHEKKKEDKKSPIILR